MSHFYVLVMLPPDTRHSQLDAELARVLAPYDENLEVPEYERPCYCVGRAAKDRANEIAESAKGIEEYRAAFKVAHPPAAIVQTGDEEKDREALLESVLSPERDKLWRAFIKPYRDAIAAALEVQPDKDKPDPKCSECGGVGTERTTYNPKSKWDWYEVGGRWNAELPGERNTGFARNLPADFTCFAIVTPDGAWHERGKMGWFGSVGADGYDEDWDEETRKIIVANPDAFVVGVDCHI